MLLIHTCCGTNRLVESLPQLHTVGQRTSALGSEDGAPKREMVLGWLLANEIVKHHDGCVAKRWSVHTHQSGFEERVPFLQLGVSESLASKNSWNSSMLTTSASLMRMVSMFLGLRPKIGLAFMSTCVAPTDKYHA